MNITIEIKAPELTKAIELLANSISKEIFVNVSKESIDEKWMRREGDRLLQHYQVSQQPDQQPVNANVVPFQQPTPTAVPTAPLQQAPAQQPMQQPIQQQAPVQQPVPTSAPSYTMDQLAVAATQLMDAGRQQDLLALLSSFGVPSLMALPKEQYGAFATKLREMGAKI